MTVRLRYLPPNLNGSVSEWFIVQSWKGCDVVNSTVRRFESYYYRQILKGRLAESGLLHWSCKPARLVTLTSVGSNPTPTAKFKWKVGRVGLMRSTANRESLTGRVGSNPTLSAKLQWCY